MSVFDVMKGAIARGFKGKLHTGILYRSTGTVQNSLGDTVATAPAQFRIEGIVTEYDEMYRQRAGIPDEDVKIVLISGNCETAAVKDDVVRLPRKGQQRYFKVRKIGQDPADATQVLQAFETVAP